LSYISTGISLPAFSALALALQHFTRKHCLQIVGLRCGGVAWSRFPIEKNCWFIRL